MDFPEQKEVSLESLLMKPVRFNCRGIIIPGIIVLRSKKDETPAKYQFIGRCSKPKIDRVLVYHIVPNSRATFCNKLLELEVEGWTFHNPGDGLYVLYNSMLDKALSSG